MGVYIVNYFAIGLVLALPLIAMVESVKEVPSCTKKEVILTVFLWPWLWLLLGQMFVEFLIKQLCIKTK